MGNTHSLPVRAMAQVRIMLNRAGFEVTREHFKHRFVYSLHQHGIDTVIDIGANTGQFGQLLRRSGFTGRIHSIEPLQSAYDELLVATVRDATWTCERAAVSDQPGTITMNVAGNSVSSSVLPMLERHATAAPQSQYVATEDVAATTVDELVDRLGIVPRTALLKIDVQGYEKAVLDGARKTLSEFGAVRTEMSLAELYEGQALLPEMVEYLGRQSFELWSVEPGFIDPGTRRLLQLDGIFFKRP